MIEDDRQPSLAEEAPATQPDEAGDSARRCVDCGAEIPAQRLEAMPETTRCVDCQRDIEASGRWDWGMAE